MRSGVTPAFAACSRAPGESRPRSVELQVMCRCMCDSKWSLCKGTEAWVVLLLFFLSRMVAVNEAGPPPQVLCSQESGDS